MTIAWYDPTNHHVSTDKNDPLFTPLGQLWPLIVKPDEKGYTTVTYRTGELSYHGVYLDGVFTKEEALVIRDEAAQLVKVFEHMDAALKKSLEKNR